MSFECCVSSDESIINLTWNSATSRGNGGLDELWVICYSSWNENWGWCTQAFANRFTAGWSASMTRLKCRWCGGCGGCGVDAWWWTFACWDGNKPGCLKKDKRNASASRIYKASHDICGGYLVIIIIIFLIFTINHPYQKQLIHIHIPKKEEKSQIS